MIEIFFGFIFIWWFPSFLVVYGWNLAWFQAFYSINAEEEYLEDTGVSLVVGAIAGLIGPFGVFISWLAGDSEAGWRWK